MMKRHASRTGLTVIELVSALALFVIILGALLVALDAATDIWSLSASKNRTQLKAQQALDWLVNDLGTAFAEPLLRPDGSAPPAATVPSSAEFPLFIAENNSNQQIGLYFIRQRSPAEMSGKNLLSLEMVAYAWLSISNSLSRYTRPIIAADNGHIEPSLSDQFASFVDDIRDITTVPTNVLLKTAAQFVPLIYQPLNPSISQSDTQPISALNPQGEKIELADLPDYVDILLAYFNQQDGASAISQTNYFTRRITLPAAQASRLP